jgi:hypothetical protein
VKLALLLGYGRPDGPTRSPSQERQDHLGRLLEAERLAGAMTYLVKPGEMGAAEFNWFVLNRLVPYGVIWC